MIISTYLKIQKTTLTVGEIILGLSFFSSDDLDQYIKTKLCDSGKKSKRRKSKKKLSKSRKRRYYL